VAASLLGDSVDTRVERLTREMGGDAADRRFLEGLLTQLGCLPGEARRRIDEAEKRAVRALVAADRQGLSVIDGSHVHYPELLRQIVDPPIVLWVKGDAGILAAPQVAVVGARAASPAGLQVARQLGHDLALAGLVVVSGMARGADGAAHIGALDGGGRTVAVLGCGADRVYPPEHDLLAARIADNGAIVSEFVPGTPPRKYHFPLRNRIISGLSRAVVVIEASDQSGSLITARSALEQGRDVLAVPGVVLSGRSRGCHALIRDGARLVDSVADVLEEIGWTPARSRVVPTNKSLQTSELEETMAAGESYTVDDLSARTGRSAAALLAELAELEVAGRIARVAGGSFVKT
jgi:DNA processing protein